MTRRRGHLLRYVAPPKMKLYRPVGLNELRLIYETEMAEFPPRLPHQPIFYPVLNLPYAEAISRNWNTKEDPFAGYVTEFEIDDEYVSQFEPQCVGDRNDLELWVPAEELTEFNSFILRPINVPIAFFGDKFVGDIPTKFMLANRTADEQLKLLSDILDYNAMDFHCEISANHQAVFLNYAFWLTATAEMTEIPDERKHVVLDTLRNIWERRESRVQLPTCGKLAT
jgi:hypothetical protein